MKKRRKSRLPAIIVLLVIALAAVIALIIWKQWEYSTSANFYDGLRGALQHGGLYA